MRFVILGGGAVTTELYLPALRAMGRLADVTVVDREPAAHQAVFAAASFVRDDYRSWLDAQPVVRENACLVVALPNQLHVEASRLGLANGWNVLCEKPLALEARDCADLAAMAERSGRRLLVAMSRRYLASLRLAREMVTTGELGAVRAIEIRDCVPFAWRPRSFAFFAREAGGVLADMGVHYLDYVETLLGPLMPVAYEDDARGGIEASAAFRLRAVDVPISMRLSRLRETGAWLRIRCTRGEVLVEKTRESDVLVRMPGRPARRIVVERPFEDAGWPSGFIGSYAQMLSDVERAIAGAPSAIATAADAGRTAALIEWAYARRPAHTAPIACPVGSRSSGRMLVTGGTGFIGGHLVERLATNGAAVRVAARTPGRCANVARFPVALCPIELLDRRSVAAAVEGCRIVYHLACGRDGPDPARITIEGTRNVVEAAIAAGAACVVVLSSMYVFGFPRTNAPVDESFSYRPFGGEYGRSKAKMERWCLARARTSGRTRIVVLVPTCVLGPGGGAYTTLPVDLARKGQLCWIDGGRGAANYVYVDNLVDAMLLAAEKPAAHGERFIVNDGTVTWRELLGPLVAPLGATVPDIPLADFARLPRYGFPFRARDLLNAIVEAPEVRRVAKRSALVRQAFARLQSMKDGACAASPRTIQPAGPIDEAPPAWLAELFTSRQTRFSAAKARAVLGWRSRVELVTAQAATVAWLVESGRLPATDDVHDIHDVDDVDPGRHGSTQRASLGHV